MYKIFYLFLTLTISLYAQTNPLHVRADIYKNISFITKSFQINGQKNISLKVPAQINLEDISIKAKNCSFDDVVLSNSKNYVDKKSKKLIKKIKKLNNQIISLKETNNILKTISLKEKKGIDLPKTIDYFSKNFMRNIEKLTEAQIELKKANEELKILQNQKSKKYKIFNASATCKDKKIIQITYLDSNFKIKNFYNIKLDSENRTLTLIKKIKIIQKTGEDFDNLDIYAHSNVYNRTISPIPFYPRYLNFNQKNDLLMKSSMPVAIKSMARKTDNKYKENITTSSFVALHVKIRNDKEKIIELGKVTKNVKIENDIDGYGTFRAYLKAKFKSNKQYPRAPAFIYLDDNQIGTRVLPNIKKGSQTNIYFGENQNIKIKKTLLKRFNESEFFGNNQINTQIWKYKITNMAKSVQNINLIERLPISQNEKIKVEPLFDTKKAKIDKRGKVVWSFDLKQNETKIIKFGYKTKKPKK